MKRLIDLDHPFFGPLWARIATVAVCVVWGLVELSRGFVLWGVAFVLAGAFCAWRFRAAHDGTQPVVRSAERTAPPSHEGHLPADPSAPATPGGISAAPGGHSKSSRRRREPPCPGTADGSGVAMPDPSAIDR